MKESKAADSSEFGQSLSVYRTGANVHLPAQEEGGYPGGRNRTRTSAQRRKTRNCRLYLRMSSGTYWGYGDQFGRVLVHDRRGSSDIAKRKLGNRDIQLYAMGQMGGA